jgi:UDP-N-acetylglucosamine 1-carboxyvinyltransferase
MAASLLTDEPLRLTNMPRLADTRFLGKLLQRLGAEIRESDGTDGPETVLHTPEILGAIAPYDLVRQMRASFNVLGPLVARTGQAKVSLPGGCTIGARPVDLHLKALEALGARIDLHEGYVYAQAPRGLRGAEIEFPFVSVGATEHALLAAVLAEGETVLRNAACEPEIGDLADCLNNPRCQPTRRRGSRRDSRPYRDRDVRACRGDGGRRSSADQHKGRVGCGPAG